MLGRIPWRFLLLIFEHLSHMAKQTVLLVDQETDFLDWAKHQLETVGTRVITETSADAAYKSFCMETPELVMAELNLSPFSGIELLAQIRKHSPNAMVIIVSAFGTNQNVIEAMKMGAFDFVRKEQLPFNLKIVVDSALKAAAELKAANTFKPVLTIEQHQDEIVGRSDAMQQVFKMIGRVAASDAPVMITGESGSGKELVARAIHNYSTRSGKSFLAINCAAIPENLLESELFGHEKGSFTGAHSQRIGRFEQSDNGTLFLDEIGEMPVQVQSKILRVLQEGEFSRVGGNQTIRANVRIVCATNKNLEEEVAQKRFREDLFYRLNVVRIHLPPLRSRQEDIRQLAEYFLQKIAHHKHKPLLKLSEEAARCWRGIRGREMSANWKILFNELPFWRPRTCSCRRISRLGKSPRVRLSSTSMVAVIPSRMPSKPSSMRPRPMPLSSCCRGLSGNLRCERCARRIATKSGRRSFLA